MKTVLKKITITTMCVFMACGLANAQFSFSGQLGYASPQGTFFKNDAGEDLSKFGLGLDLDALYHFEQFNNKLGVGVTYNSSFLFGADLGGGMDIGMYGLNLYGVKGLYRFFNSKVSPYGSVSFGLSHFSTPEVSINGSVIAKSQNAFGFGVRPELGLDLGGFLISVGYFVPMKYTIEDVSKTAGSLQVSLGYRHTIFN